MLTRSRGEAISLAEETYQIRRDNCPPDKFEFVVHTLQNYSKSYCKDCCQTGQKIIFEPSTSLFMTDTCECRVKVIADRVRAKNIQDSCIPKKYQDATLTNWFNPGQNDREQSINWKGVHVVRSYIENLGSMRENGLGLFLCGPHGVGKTFLACCAGLAAVDSGYSVRYATLSRLIELRIDSWFKEEGAEQARDYREADFLILDDIDKIYRTKTGIETRLFDNLLRERLQENRPLIATTNKPIVQMKDDFGNAIYSMLMEQNAELVFVGQDDRKKKNGDVKQRIINGG